MSGGIHAISWAFSFSSSLWLLWWCIQKSNSCLQCQITAGFILLHGYSTVIFVKDNCGSLLKGFLRFYVFLLVCLFVVVVWRGENRSQRSEKALWSHWSNGIHVQKYGQSYSHGLFTFLCMDPSYAPSITFTTSFPAPHFLLTKWVLPLGLHSCLLRLHVKICGNMLITLKKTMADFLPMVSMSFENEPSETI